MKPKTEMTPENFPALHTFLRGYFHEDLRDEYGTAPEAADQFCDDADSDERVHLRRTAQQRLESHREEAATRTCENERRQSEGDVLDRLVTKRRHEPVV